MSRRFPVSCYRLLCTTDIPSCSPSTSVYHLYVFTSVHYFDTFHAYISQEIWNVDAGRLTHQGKAAIVEDAFEDSKENSRVNSRAASRLASRAGSKTNSPSSSVAPSAANSGDEGTQPVNGSIPMPIVKKKKLTRKQVKEQEERRRLRTIAFLSNSTPGAVREPDTDSD